MKSRPGRVTVTCGSDRSQASSPPAAVATRTTWWPVECLTSLVGPDVTSRPWSMIATESTAPRPCSSWWVLKTRVLPRSRISRNADLSSATLTGSRPGERLVHERCTSGSWRTVAMNWTFCWLPFESVSALRSATSPIRNRASQPSASARARLARHVIERARRRRAGRARPSARTGRAPRACSPRSGAATPASRGRARSTALVGPEEAEDDPHRRRLAGAVRAEETEDSPPSTVNVTPSSAWTSPNRLVRPSIASAMSSLPPPIRAPRPDDPASWRLSHARVPSATAEWAVFR